MTEDTIFYTSQERIRWARSNRERRDRDRDRYRSCMVCGARFIDADLCGDCTRLLRETREEYDRQTAWRKAAGR